MSDLFSAVTDLVESVIGELADARHDSLKRQRLAEMTGLSADLPDFLERGAEKLRPGESRAEQLERLLVIVDNVIDWTRTLEGTTDAHIIGTEFVARIAVPLIAESIRTQHPKHYPWIAVLLFADERLGEFFPDGVSYDRYGALVRALVDQFRGSDDSTFVVNTIAALAALNEFWLKRPSGVPDGAGVEFSFSYGFEAPTIEPSLAPLPEPPPPPPPPTAIDLAQRSFSMWWHQKPGQPVTDERYEAAPYDPRPREPGVYAGSFVPVLTELGGPAMLLQANLGGEVTGELGENWQARLRGSADFGALIPWGEATIRSGVGDGVSLRGELIWNGGDKSEPIKCPGGAEISASSITFSAFVDGGLASPLDGGASSMLGDIGAAMRIERLKFFAPPPDNVLKYLFPEGGTFDLDVGVRYSARDKLQLEGGTGLEIYNPIHKQWALTAAGTTWLEAEITYVRLRGEVKSQNNERGLLISATAGFGLGILGITLVVDGLGVGFEAKTTDGTTGNFLRLGNWDVKPVYPNGIGARIDLGPFEGGGYFSYDAVADRYAGAIEIKLGSKWALRGLGFIEPRESGGTSLVMLVNLELDTWSPGFQIDGFGIIVATHRRADGEALRRAVETGDLDALLFPSDPIRRVPELVASLNRFFPLEDNTHVIGIVVRMSYGLGLVRVRAGALVQIGVVDKLIIAIIAKLVLPEPFDNVLVLELVGVGEYDFSTDVFDARLALRNSHIAGGELTGSAVIFSGDPGGEPVGDGKGFWASVGGYHPRYEDVPARVAVSNRLSLSWHKGDDLEATLKGYVALTPGAFHLGAEMTVRATLEGFGIKGTLGFDSLMDDDLNGRFDLHGEINVLLFSRTLCGLSFIGSITWHSPTDLDGKAKVSFLFWSKTFPYSKRLVEAKERTVDSTDIPDRLAESFKTGWKSSPDPDVVVVRKSTTAWAIPNQPLRWSQSVVPLGVPVTRVGPIKLASAHTFVVDQLGFEGSSTTTVATLQASFARAQYRELADDDRFRGPAFARYDAGFELGSTSVGGDEAPSLGPYQEIVVDRGRRRRPPRRGFVATAALLDAGLALDADIGTWHRTPPTPVRIAEVGYQVVGVTSEPSATFDFDRARAARRVNTRLTRVIR